MNGILLVFTINVYKFLRFEFSRSTRIVLNSRRIITCEIDSFQYVLIRISEYNMINGSTIETSEFSLHKRVNYISPIKQCFDGIKQYVYVRLSSIYTVYALCTERFNNILSDEYIARFRTTHGTKKCTR